MKIPLTVFNMMKWGLWTKIKLRRSLNSQGNIYYEAQLSMSPKTQGNPPDAAGLSIIP